MADTNWQQVLEKVDDLHWCIPQTFMPGMRVPGLIIASKQMLARIADDQTPEQVANVAHLPGILNYSLAMPDIHWGYGLPIGGVAAVRRDGGVISPGGVGSDINCGVRLVRTDLTAADLRGRIADLIDALFTTIPCGVGGEGDIKLSPQDTEKVLVQGARWVVKHGHGWPEDVEFCEERGALDGADPGALSSRARERGKTQLGTLGAGNHFLEIQIIDSLYDEPAAAAMGLFLGQVVVMVHSGSRGLGYQVCEDFMRSMGAVMKKYDIRMPDRQLACAPLDSPEGLQYLGAMRAAANYAWANRQALTHGVRAAFEKVLGQSAEKLGMRLVYDVAHNIAKFETHAVNGKDVEVCVHRKGATRAFPPGHADLPEKYKETGQPVLIPGSMGTHSYVLAGTRRAMAETFGSTCHGAGRVMSRHQAVKQTNARELEKELAGQGILVRCKSRATLSEECPAAYKDIDQVVEVVDRAGLSRNVVRMHPVGVVKG